MKIYNIPTRPFFVLAPMDDVTDIVFRQSIASMATADMFFTEFVNVEGLQSRGRANIIHKLKLEQSNVPVVAQIWGKNPENYKRTASELVNMGFDGVDINMGCPKKSEVNSGCCSALINNRELAVDIIRATQAGVAGRVPVSVKTRLGWGEVDFSWHELLLNQGLDMLTIHGRTTKQMSKVPANWDDIKRVRELRDKIAPKTLIVGNGDVQNRQHGENLAKTTGVDGVMVGRAIFNDPYLFAKNSPWQDMPISDKLELYKKHILLFSETYQNREKNWQGLKRLAKMYVNSIENASDIREKLVRSDTVEDMLNNLNSNI